MKNKVEDVSKLNDKQKINYVKNILFNNEINEAIDILLKDEKKDLTISRIILDVLNEEIIVNRIKEQCNLTSSKNAKLFVCSKMLGIFAFYNKTVILNNFFKFISKEQLKDIAIFEYQNNTNVSLENKIFNKYCSKYKKEALDDLMIDEEEKEKFNKEKESYNSIPGVSEKKKSKKLYVLIIILVFLISSILGYKLYDYNEKINEYNGLIYPGIYLNDNDLSGTKISDIKSLVTEEKEKILNGSLIITNINGDYKYSYRDLGIVVEDKEVISAIKDYNNNLSFFKKIKYLSSKGKNKMFYLKASTDSVMIDDFINKLKLQLNTDPRSDGLIIDDDYNVSYDKGINGFTLNEEETKEIIKKALTHLKEETVIEVSGNVVKNEVKNESLSSVNTKVSSYTTYFVNAGNRGHNINLASSRLNDTILMPGDTFSYLKVVGPYGASNGYLPAPIYLNGDTATANGGGVCQLASTLYNAQLRAGLETVSRRGHTFAPNYVPKGLDATVYSTTTDYKFKNNHEYPIYIVSYVKGNYLTVDIWSNENALEGKMYEPYSVASNGGWLAYLKTIQDGKVIETKYLDKSVYKAH